MTASAGLRSVQASSHSRDPSIDVTGWLVEQVAQASPDLLRAVMPTFAEALTGAEADGSFTTARYPRVPDTLRLCRAVVRTSTGVARLDSMARCPSPCRRYCVRFVSPTTSDRSGSTPLPSPRPPRAAPGTSSVPSPL